MEPAGVGEQALGFRLGPRINAAGRMQRAAAALELLLTEDEARAAEVARELDLLNRDRQEAETRILFAAEGACAPQASAAAIVVAGEGWHPGRGGDRGVAAGGALAPALRGDLPGRRAGPRLGAQRLSRTTFTRGSDACADAPASLRRSPDGGRGGAPDRGARALPARAGGPRRRRAEPVGPAPDASAWTPWCPAARSRLELAEELERLRPVRLRQSAAEPCSFPASRVENVAGMGDGAPARALHPRHRRRLALARRGLRLAAGIAQRRRARRRTTSCSASSATAGRAWRSRGSCCARSARPSRARSGCSARRSPSGRGWSRRLGSRRARRGRRDPGGHRRSAWRRRVRRRGGRADLERRARAGRAWRTSARRRESLETLVAGLADGRPRGGVMGRRSPRDPAARAGLRPPGGARPAARRSAADPLLGRDRARAPRVGPGRGGVRARRLAPRARASARARRLLPRAARARRSRLARDARADRCAGEGRHPRTPELCARLLASAARARARRALASTRPPAAWSRELRTELGLSPTYRACAERYERIERGPGARARRSRAGAGAQGVLRLHGRVPRVAPGP